MFSIRKSLILGTGLWVVVLITGYFSAMLEIPEWAILLPIIPLVVLPSEECFVNKRIMKIIGDVPTKNMGEEYGK
jgi:hypothetical protein